MPCATLQPSHADCNNSPVARIVAMRLSDLSSAWPQALYVNAEVFEHDKGHETPPRGDPFYDACRAAMLRL